MTLRQAWESVFGKPSCSWRQVAGPISALRMSLVRLGWQMNNFMTLIDDRGFSIPLGIFSPALVRLLVKDGYFRMLERESGEKRGVLLRVCYDIVREALHSKKYTALQKARIRAFATEAFFTGFRAKCLGYLIEDTCPFCGCQDTIFHRLWECPHGPVAELRADLVDASIIESALAAKAAEDDVFVYISGAFRHPADSYPRPCSEFDDGPVLVWHRDDILNSNGQRPGNELWGSLFVDGSCARHPIRELSRAASSVIMVDNAGDNIAEFRAPVWAPYPQTPQRGV